MTRAETIKWLESLKKEVGKAENHTLWHYAEAIDMAIEALSADGDLISRQDAIECVKWGESVTNVIDKINALPSANLQQTCNNLATADRPTGHIVTKSSGKFNPTVWAACSECGKPIDPWDKFCRHCGAKIGDEDND